MAKGLANISPNTLSAIAFGAAVLAGLAFYLGGGLFLGLAFLLVLANALFDALDGKVAKLTGKASARGDFLDHVLDRYADVVILTGIALGPAGTPLGLEPVRFTVLGWAMVLFAVLGNVTAIQRAISVWRRLS